MLLVLLLLVLSPFLQMENAALREFQKKMPPEMAGFVEQLSTLPRKPSEEDKLPSAVTAARRTPTPPPPSSPAARDATAAVVGGRSPSAAAPASPAHATAGGSLSPAGAGTLARGTAVVTSATAQQQPQRMDSYSQWLLPSNSAGLQEGWHPHGAALLLPPAQDHHQQQHQLQQQQQYLQMGHPQGVAFDPAKAGSMAKSAGFSFPPLWSQLSLGAITTSTEDLAGSSDYSDMVAAAAAAEILGGAHALTAQLGGGGAGAGQLLLNAAAGGVPHPTNAGAAAGEIAGGEAAGAIGGRCDMNVSSPANSIGGGPTTGAAFRGPSFHDQQPQQQMHLTGLPALLRGNAVSVTRSPSAAAGAQGKMSPTMVPAAAGGGGPLLGVSFRTGSGGEECYSHSLLREECFSNSTSSSLGHPDATAYLTPLGAAAAVPGAKYTQRQQVVAGGLLMVTQQGGLQYPMHPPMQSPHTSSTVPGRVQQDYELLQQQQQQGAGSSTAVTAAAVKTRKRGFTAVIGGPQPSYPGSKNLVHGAAGAGGVQTLATGPTKGLRTRRRMSKAQQQFQAQQQQQQAEQEKQANMMLMLVKGGMSPQEAAAAAAAWWASTTAAAIPPAIAAAAPVGGTTNAGTSPAGTTPAAPAVATTPGAHQGQVGPPGFPMRQPRSSDESLSLTPLARTTSVQLAELLLSPAPPASEGMV